MFVCATNFLLMKMIFEKGARQKRLLGTEKQPASGEEDGLPQDELIAFYGEVKEHLDQEDINDLKTFMRMRAEIRKNQKKEGH